LKTPDVRSVTSGMLSSVVLLALAAAVVAPGCDSMSFVPPPPAEMRNPPETSSLSSRTGPMNSAPTSNERPSIRVPARSAGGKRQVAAARTVELILATPPSVDRIILEQTLRREAGRAKMAFRTVKPEALREPSQHATPRPLNPAELAEAIAAAVARGAAALIVEPNLDPGVVDALYQARAYGVAVLLLDRPVPPRGGQSIPWITFASFAGPGREIVETVLDAASRLGRLKERVLVLENRSPDPYGARRLESLTTALKAARRAYELVAFEGDSSAALAALRKSLAADSKVAILLAEEDNGLWACHAAQAERRKENQPEFILGGYISYDIRSANEKLAGFTAFGDRAVEPFAMKAFRTVQSLIEGKPVGERVEMPINVHKVSTIFVPKSTPVQESKRPQK
jgi:ABC-type sugar transport system substrate-binding protein